MAWLVIGWLLILVTGIRFIAPAERAQVLRFGKSTNRVVGPGVVWILPVVQTLRRVSMDPFTVPLPPQAGITRDEDPIQLQASLDAAVRDPGLAVSKVKDWRIFLMSQLQDLMKDRLEDLEFDNLDAVFPDWTSSIRS